MSDLLEHLNNQQKQAVTHGDGPLLIVAGAGTGKTTVLTHRIAWLLEQGKAKSDQILALTFTDKAAGEMEERVDRLLPFGYLDLHIQTFHAFCERVLREYGVEIGLPRDFRVVNELDAWLLARRHFEEFPLKLYRTMGNPTRHLKSLLAHVASAKDEGILLDAYTKFATSQADDRLLELAAVYAAYEKILQDDGALDFGNLLLETLRLFNERPQALAALRARFPYILVDEWQDTNAVQYELVRLLAAPKNNLTVVGDDDQAIYRFRGASSANLLAFARDYPDAARVVLTDNYRSGQPILDLAYTCIQKNNPERLEVQIGLSKKLMARGDASAKIQHHHAATIDEEAAWVAETILELRASEKDFAWSDVAVLVRANNHADPFLAALAARGIPYRFSAQKGLYAQPIIIDVLAWMRLLLAPQDSVAAYRILTQTMWQMPMADIQLLLGEANRRGKPLWDTMVSPPEAFSADGHTAGDRLRTVYGDLCEQVRFRPVTELMILLAKQTGLYTYVNALPEWDKRAQFAYLQQFLQRLKRFEAGNDDKTLRPFLAEFEEERMAGSAGEIADDIEEGPDVVRVMTIHSAKGLEWRDVFIVNLVDRRFPSDDRAQTIPLPIGLLRDDEREGEHLEEERRLFYVAITRAKERLFLTSAEDYGSKRKKKRSLFLHELGFGGDAAVSANSREPSEPEEKIEANTPTYLLPKFFSFTQLQAFQTCPLQYKFAHILRIPTFGSYTMSYGKSVHAALERFFEQWIASGIRGTKEDLAHILDELWIDDWYPDDTMRETYRQRGKEALHRVHDRLVAESPTPLGVEVAFTEKIGGVILKGKIDRVDRWEDGLHLIDYKTGEAKTEKELLQEKRDQLLLYHMAAEEIYQLPVRRLTYYYLDDDSMVDLTLKLNELERIRDRVLEIIAQLGVAEFAATPGRHCRFCDFADICEFRDL